VFAGERPFLDGLPEGGEEIGNGTANAADDVVAPLIPGGKSSALTKTLLEQLLIEIPQEGALDTRRSTRSQNR